MAPRQDLDSDRFDRRVKEGLPGADGHRVEPQGHQMMLEPRSDIAQASSGFLGDSRQHRGNILDLGAPCVLDVWPCSLYTAVGKAPFARSVEPEGLTTGSKPRRDMPMHKVIFGIGVAWLLIIAGNVSLVYGQVAATTGAIEESTQLGRDLFLTIGFDIWPNQWQKTYSALSAPNPYGGGPLIVNANSVNNIQASSAFNVGFIPTATLTYKNLFLSGSYMATLDYQFGTSSQIVTTPAFRGDGTFVPDIPLGLETELEASRQEWDFIMGYFPLEWLGIAIGYKGIVQDYELKQTLTPPINGSFTNPEADEPTTSNSKIRYNGPILGVLANTRLSDNFALLGNVFGGYLFVDCTPSCTQTVVTDPSRSTGDRTNRSIFALLGSQSLVEDSPFVSSKLMLRYAPTSLPALSLTLSYRVQLIISESDISSGPGIDVTHGPVIGVNYRF
jgi:hypothetical protein